MSNTNDYAEAQSAAQKLPADQVLTPRIPIGIYLQEAENLNQVALADMTKLIGAGLTEKVIANIQLYAGACREAQSIWNREYNARQVAEQQWAEQMPLGYDLRDKLAHAFGYAFRADEALMKKVHAIRAGRGHADMIQDLSDIAVLGRANQHLLDAIHFDAKELDIAADLSSALASLFAQANGERLSENNSKQMRDRMYTLLKHAVDEVYSCGRYLFWNDEKRLKLYRSAYEYSHRTKPKKDASPE